LARRWIFPNIPGFKSDSIHDRNVDSVRNGMSPLVVRTLALSHAEFFLLRQLPAVAVG
jgi:hypothetical protein